MGTYLYAAPQVNWPAREDHGVKYSATWQTIAIWDFWKDYPLQLTLSEVARAGGYEVAARDESWPEESEDSFGKMVLPVAALPSEACVYATSLPVVSPIYNALQASVMALVSGYGAERVRVLFWKD